ncbi:MAG: PD-(D/E)XK nuclease family protein [Chloroflexi bacterium]|nr:PD-(D/E)XK nuclease family protein [Chloroflexota bacterium]
MPPYSFTRLNTYQTCPRKYKFSYVDRIKDEEESVEFFLGSRVHETMKWLYDDVRNRNIPSLGDVVCDFVGRWDKNWNSSVKIVQAQYGPAHYKNIGLECLIRYYQRYYPFAASSTLDTERWVYAKLVDRNTGEIFALQGLLDRLDRAGDGVYEIHDYKTSRYLPSQAEVDGDMQLSLYEIGLRQQFPDDVKKVDLVWHYMAHEREMRSIRTPEQLGEIEHLTIQTIRAIESDTEFRPIESRLCDWCAYQPLCPAKKHLFETEMLPAEEFLAEEGVGLVNAYTEAKAKRKELETLEEEAKERLVEYARHFGLAAVRGSDIVAKINISVEHKYPDAKDPRRGALEGLLKQLGLWEELTSLNTGNLDKKVAAAAWDETMKDQIREFGQPKESVAVRLVRLKDEGHE